MTAVLQHSLETMQATATEDEEIVKPKELVDLTKWEKFWEQWKSYARCIQGAVKCPLTYVFQDHQLVDQAMHQAVYNDHDEKLINTKSLTGPWFELDNQCIYEEFKALTLKGPSWSFIKSYDHTKNGCGAVLTLCHQCEGTLAIQTQKAVAYAKISSARYSGQKRQFSFDNYVKMHRITPCWISKRRCPRQRKSLTSCLVSRTHAFQMQKT
jgi:hypothetical protein